MNAKEQYATDYSQIKSSPSLRWSIENGFGTTRIEEQAMKSYRAVEAKNPMTFRQFIDCLEAAQNGLAYSTRNHWFFVVDGQELQFTKEECARFARYFSEGFHMNLDKYTKIIKAGGCYINERLFEDDEVFPLKAKKSAYMRFVIGNKKYSEVSQWVGRHEFVEVLAYVRIPDQADYQTEQSDINAEMLMQRYGV